VLTVGGQHACKLVVEFGKGASDDELTATSPPAEETAARQEQTGKSRTGDGAESTLTALCATLPLLGELQPLVR
jgi:hypothetical protein